MKIDKEEVNMAWLTLGRLVVGTILCGAGLVTAIKGACCCGMLAIAEQLREASPEDYDKIAEKL